MGGGWFGRHLGVAGVLPESPHHHIRKPASQYRCEQSQEGQVPAHHSALRGLRIRGIRGSSAIHKYCARVPDHDLMGAVRTTDARRWRACALGHCLLSGAGSKPAELTRRRLVAARAEGLGPLARRVHQQAPPCARCGRGSRRFRPGRGITTAGALCQSSPPSSACRGLCADPSETCGLWKLRSMRFRS